MIKFHGTGSIVDIRGSGTDSSKEYARVRLRVRRAGDMLYDANGSPAGIHSGYFTLTAFGANARRLRETARVGDIIEVRGSIRDHSWTVSSPDRESPDAEDGNGGAGGSGRRRIIQFIVEEFEFVPRRGQPSDEPDEESEESAVVEEEIEIAG